MAITSVFINTGREKDLVHIYNGTFSAVKKKKKKERKKEIMSFAAIWMNQEIIMISEVNETEKDNNVYHLYVESKI